MTTARSEVFAAARRRTEALLVDLPIIPDHRDRIAYRRLFSELASLEEIAVLAAERGDGVEGQLEDELHHVDVFRGVAKSLGGCHPPSDGARALIDFLGRLQGPMSVALLNVVAEHWLENVFHHVGAWETPYGAIFAAVDEDERRHVHEALRTRWPHWTQLRPVMGDLELLLARYAGSPEWLLPLRWIGGDAAVARMGLDGVRSHEDACAHLGIPPGPMIREVEVGCQVVLRPGLSGRPAVALDGDVWERSKPRIWSQPAMMLDYVEVPAPALPPAEIEALVVRALGRAISRHPRLLRSIRAGTRYRPDEIVVGVRRQPKGPYIVGTVMVRHPHRLSVAQVARVIRLRTDRMRTRRFEEVPQLGELEALLPPPAVCATVTQVGHFGVTHGAVTTSDLEGAPIAVVVGRVHDRPWWDGESYRPRPSLVLGIFMDHRAGDGREIGALATELRRELGG